MTEHVRARRVHEWQFPRRMVLVPRFESWGDEPDEGREGRGAGGEGEVLGLEREGGFASLMR